MGNCLSLPKIQLPIGISQAQLTAIHDRHLQIHEYEVNRRVWPGLDEFVNLRDAF